MSFECDICGKVFDEEQNFKSHIESVHEGKKPYECDICGKVFNGKQNFKSHLKSVREKKKPYKYGYESIWIFHCLRCPKCEYTSGN